MSTDIHPGERVLVAARRGGGGGGGGDIWLGGTLGEVDWVGGKAHWTVELDMLDGFDVRVPFPQVYSMPAVVELALLA